MSNNFDNWKRNMSAQSQPQLQLNIINYPRQNQKAEVASADGSEWEEVYHEKVNQFYKAVESLKDKSVQKRIRPQVVQYLFYMVSQTLIMLLKFLIFNDTDSHLYRTYVELFSIAVFTAFIYFYAVETFQLGICKLLQFQFHMDQLQLSGVVAIMMGQYIIGLLGLGAEHTLAFRITYPLWVFYQGSTTRIQVASYRCNRFQTVSSKVLLLAQFILTLVTVARYASLQLYKKLDSDYDDTNKLICFLFLAAHAIATANYYKLYSKFDGTNALRYDFLFENSLEAKIRTQIKQLKKKLLAVQPKKSH